MHLYKEKPTKIREDDDKSFQFTRALLEQSGLIKKRNNKLSPTKIGLKLLANDAALFKQLLETCSTQFDWSKMDGYENNDIGVQSRSTLQWQREKKRRADPPFTPHTDRPLMCLDDFLDNGQTQTVAAFARGR